ncbi:M90 family metallopeptidase [Inhella gelatinilytica]|uniref:Zinc-dependent peptidase n=1 Tax=Inhella gelatinilytica TaxID=2795030 RepID=A0A931NEW3_9BURK|nr:M90 family metallopeptidase [Inhella gelatinilytica]MBH9554119.1 zinc-dependent peptidase [Inhella gelatinilytica]
MLAWLSQWRKRRALRRHAISEALWAEVLAAYPFIARRPAAVRNELRTLCSLFLSRKQFFGAGGLALNDFMVCAVAAQACLPILRLGLGVYEGQVGIVVHPHEVRARRVEQDPHGLVHEWDEELSGEAMAGGPLMLCWTAAARPDDPTQPVFNVVIHEFVHVLDLGNGESDGLPRIENKDLRRRWVHQLPRAWDRLANRIAHAEPSCMDPYGTEALDEFFAVASEAFFVDPEALNAEDAELYGLLRDYFQQDPATA